MTSVREAEADRALMSRIMWRIMPLLVACMIVSTIEKSNVGYAKLGLIEDLGFTEAVVGFGASLFFVGYVLLEIPSAMANYRYGARLWFARIMVTWAITTLLLVFVRSAEMFYLLRFLLGAAEAGLYPSLIFYLTLWFPENERARAMGYLTLGSAFGNSLSAMISGSLLDFGGAFELAGWQWVFIVTGLLPLITTVFVLLYLPSNANEAKFLQPHEKERVNQLIAANAAKQHHGGVLALLVHPVVIGFGVLYAVLLGALYGVNYWMPTVINEFGVSGSMNGVIISAPWAFDALLLVWLMPKLRSPRTVVWGLVAFSVIGVLSFGAAATTGGLALKAAAVMLGIPAISLSVACFWTIPVKYFSGAQSAAAIGAISMIGNMGGVATLNLMPAIATGFGSPQVALWVPGVGMGLIAIWGIFMVGKMRPANVAVG